MWTNLIQFIGKLSIPWIRHYFILKIWNLLHFSMRKVKKHRQKKCSKPNELVEFDIMIHNVQAFPFCCRYARGNYFLCQFTKFLLEVWNSMDQWKCTMEITKRKCTIKCTCNLAYNWEFDQQIMVDHHHVICDKILIVEPQGWRPTPLWTYHPTCYETKEDCILLNSCFVKHCTNVKFLIDILSKWQNRNFIFNHAHINKWYISQILSQY